MKEIRRSRLVGLLASPRFNGDRAKFCADAGITNGRLSQLLDPSEAFGDVAARNLCDALGLSKDYFSDSGAASIALPSLTISASGGPQLIDLDNNPLYPSIRKVRFKLSAGASGFGVDYEGEDHDPIVFGAYWYKVNKLRPEALFAVRVANGSMEPGLSSGDIVVVNTASIEPRDGVVFAINYEGEMVIKRLIRDDGEWWLHSDNPDQVRYKRKRMHGDCFLIGEVIQKQSMKI